MSFIKHAIVSSLGSAISDKGGIKKIAKPEQKVLPSYFLDGSRKFDLKAALNKASKQYDISDNPSDYIYEVIRANTANICNENYDAFHKSELLRFDTRRGMPVYMTYAGCPHHVNHDTSDPKKARGLILDAHYNDDAAAMDSCPTCGSPTGDEENRDTSGIYCNSCHTPVKDEFVEIIVAVDSKKDPKMVAAIKNGSLNAGSMGCVAQSTVCNVCDKVARTTKDFCEHIRSASKGSLWARKGNKFERVTPEHVKQMLKEAGWKVNPNGRGICETALKIPNTDFEVRRAFENCLGVEFEEYSRVHRPADYKARTIEILSPSNKSASAKEAKLSIEEETDLLIRNAKLEKYIEEHMPKSAQYMPPVEADVDVKVPDGLQVSLEPKKPGTSAPGAPDETDGTQSIEQLTHEETNPQEEEQGQSTPEEFGMLPVGAEGNDDMEMGDTGFDMDAGPDPADDEMDEEYARAIDSLPEGEEILWLDEDEDMPGQQKKQSQVEDQNAEMISVLEDAKSLGDEYSDTPEFQDFIESIAYYEDQLKSGKDPVDLYDELYTIIEDLHAMQQENGMSPAAFVVWNKLNDIRKVIEGEDAEEDLDLDDEEEGEEGEEGEEYEDDDEGEMLEDEDEELEDEGENLEDEDEYEDEDHEYADEEEEEPMTGQNPAQKPAQAPKPDYASDLTASSKFACVYENFVVDAFADHAIISSPGGAVMRIKSAKLLPTEKTKIAFGQQIVDSLLDNGLVKTAKLFGGQFNKRIAANDGSLAGATFNFEGGRPKPTGDGSLAGAHMNTVEQRKTPPNLVKSPGATEGHMDNFDAKRPFPHNSIEGRETNLESEAVVESPKENSVDGYEDNLEDKRPEYRKDESSLDGATTNLKGNAGAGKKSAAKLVEERLKQIHANKIASLTEEHAKELATVKTAEQERIFRAIRLAQRRAALNIEPSPLKAALYESLTVPRPVGRSASTGHPIEFAGLDDNLSLHLLETTWEKAASEEIEHLLERTAELLGYNDEYLISAEKDLSKQAAIIPQIIEVSQVEPQTESQIRAAEMRRCASSDDFVLPLVSSDHDEEQNGVRGAIRSALSITRAGRKFAELVNGSN